MIMFEKSESHLTKTQLTITLILIMFLSIMGTTYAYYAVVDNNNNTITGDMANVDLTLNVTRVYPLESADTTGVMIPQLSSDAALTSALKGKCVDGNKNVACQVYKVEIENRGGSSTQVVDGNIYFYSDSYLTRDISTEMPNLKWRLVSSVNESNPNSSILGSNVNNVAGSSGNSKFVSNLTLETNSKFTYYLMVWIDEINEDQVDKSSDAVTKTFYGKVLFDSSNGTGVTATFQS